MKAAPRLEIVAPLAARATYLVTAYADVIDNPARLSGVLGKLTGHQSAAQIAEWQGMAAAQEMEALAASLMAVHYDPRYAKGRAEAVGITQIATEDLTVEAQENLADQIAALIDTPRG